MKKLILMGTMLLVNLVFLSLMTSCQNVKNVSVQQNVSPEEEEPFPFDRLDVKPTFQGKDANAFVAWVYSNVSYPKTAIDSGIQGRVIVKFIIEGDGKVSNVGVEESAHPDLDAEAVRIISSSPDWEPAKVDGKHVRVKYMFPIIFKLRAKTPNPSEEAKQQ